MNYWIIISTFTLSWKYIFSWLGYSSKWLLLSFLLAAPKPQLDSDYYSSWIEIWCLWVTVLCCCVKSISDSCDAPASCFHFQLICIQFWLIQCSQSFLAIFLHASVEGQCVFRLKIFYYCECKSIWCSSICIWWCKIITWDTRTFSLSVIGI